MGIVVGLDVGGSMTKIVAMRDKNILAKCTVRATDPVTSAFGALGRLIDENGWQIGDVSQVNITGVGASFPAGPLLGIKTVVVTEFLATGLGGLYLSGLDHAVVVSMGTGTAYLDASYEKVRHLIGSGVGGGITTVSIKVIRTPIRFSNAIGNDTSNCFLLLILSINLPYYKFIFMVLYLLKLLFSFLVFVI